MCACATDRDGKRKTWRQKKVGYGVEKSSEVFLTGTILLDILHTLGVTVAY